MPLDRSNLLSHTFSYVHRILQCIFLSRGWIRLSYYDLLFASEKQEGSSGANPTNLRGVGGKGARGGAKNRWKRGKSRFLKALRLVPQLQMPRFHRKSSKLLPLVYSADNAIFLSTSSLTPLTKQTRTTDPIPWPATSPLCPLNQPAGKHLHAYVPLRQKMRQRQGEEVPPPPATRNNPQNDNPEPRSLKRERFRPQPEGRRDCRRTGPGGGEGDVRVCAGTGPSHDSKRGPESSGRPRGEGG